LDRTRGIAQVDKGNSAMIAATSNPASQRNYLSGIGGA
jgi:hypothetical protein